MLIWVLIIWELESMIPLFTIAIKRYLYKYQRII